MKTIAAALLAAQAQPAGRPIARAALADNGRLHPAALFTHSYTGVGVRAVNCGAFFFRTRQTTGLNTLDTQKITDPTISGQWTAWTNLTGGVTQPGMAGAFWTGAYVVVVYQSNTDGQVYFRRSTDGQTFGAAAVAYADPAPSYPATLAGVSGGAAHSGVVLAYNGTIYFGPYDAAANTWGALEPTGLTTNAGLSPGLAGLYDSARGRHVVLASTVQAVAWARYAVFAVARTGAGVYGSPTPYLHSGRSAFANLTVSSVTINGFWWLVVGRGRPGLASSTYYLAASDDGLHWEDGFPLGGAIEGWLEPLGAVSGDPGPAYLASEAQVLRSTAPSYWSGQPVARYTLAAGGPEGGRLTVLVDNRAGAATTPALHSLLTLERGYQVEGVDYYVSAGVFYVTGFRYRSRDQLLELTAVDAAGLLAAWVADQAFTLRGARLDTLVEHFAALAGAHAVTFDGSALWSQTLANFTLAGGGSGLAALRALQAQAPFEVVAQADGSLYAYVPEAGPAAAATLGPGAHPLWPGEFGATVAANFVGVAGAPPASVGADAYSAAVVRAAGRRWTALRVNPRLTTNAQAGALAAALLAPLGEQARAGVVACPPHLALEPGDVLAVTDSAYAAAAGPWRVTELEEYFNESRARPFYQRLTLRGTT